MAFRAKLISLEAITVINPRGERCTVRALGFPSGVTFIATPGQRIEFEFDQDAHFRDGFPFTDSLDVILVTEDLTGEFFAGHLGTLTILPNGSSGQGELKHQFTGVLPAFDPQATHKFHYELTYEVIPEPADPAPPDPDPAPPQPDVNLFGACGLAPAGHCTKFLTGTGDKCHSCFHPMSAHRPM